MRPTRFPTHPGIYAGVLLVFSAGCTVEASPSASEAQFALESCTDSAAWFEGAFAGLPEVREELVTTLTDSRMHPGTYHVPSPERTAAFEVMLGALLDNVDRMRAGEDADWCHLLANEAKAAGYSIVRVLDTNASGTQGTGRYFILGTDVATNGEQGYFVINPGAQRNLVIESPHSGYDPDSDVGAARLFVSDLAPRAVVFNGAERCALEPSQSPAECAGHTPQCEGTSFPRSDVAHATTPLFHAFHRRLSDRGLPQSLVHAEPTRFIQVHTAPAQPVIATGTRDPDQQGAISNTIRELVSHRVRVGSRVHSCNDGNDGTPGDSIIGVATNNECADFNVQALYTNASGSVACGAQNPMAGSNRWIQVEGGIAWDSSNTSVDGTASSVGWYQVMDAVRASPWGVCDLTCTGGSACGIGPAHRPATAPACAP
jgi:hypothetical protein